MLTQTPQANATPIFLIGEEGFAEWAARSEHRTWLGAHNFRGEKNKLVLLPNAQGGVAGVAVGLGKHTPGETLNLWHAAGIPERVPEGAYEVGTPLMDSEAAQFAYGWEYGQYRFERYRKPVERGARVLCVSESIDIAETSRLNMACSLARDLINLPAGDLTPDMLTQVAVDLAADQGGSCRRYVGDELLKAGFPAVHAVGRAAAAPPQLVEFEWGDPQHPRVALVGKGVCFDSGGLDIKPPSGMLLMKKDMGGAACVLALAKAVMEAHLPIRLHVVIPAVENAISGNAFRPGDVLSTRAGLSVEVGNTDAEGRLILCDALALADAQAPDLLVDFATLTGAARVALGPELPALFSSDRALAEDLVGVGQAVADPLWPMPLWSGYEDELSSKIADLNNVSSTGFSGAIIGGLFLKRFVNKGKHWAHVDMYAWNSKDRPGRPVGAEPQCVRTLYAYLKAKFAER